MRTPISRRGESRFLDAELLSPGSRERVEARSPVVRRNLPRGQHPSLDEHPLQRRIQRSLFDRQHVRRQHLDVLRDAVAVHRLDRQRLQNQHLERARKQLVLALRLGFFHQLLFA
jgi:hypothetical protein